MSQNVLSGTTDSSILLRNVSKSLGGGELKDDSGGRSSGESRRWNLLKGIAGEPVKQGPAKITSLDKQSIIPAVTALGTNLAIHCILKNLEKRTLKKVNEKNKKTSELANTLRVRGDDMTVEQFVESLAELAKERRKNELRASDGTKQFIRDESEKYLTGSGVFFVVAIIFPPAAFVGLGVVGLGACVIGTKYALQVEQDRRDAKGVRKHVFKQAENALSGDDMNKVIEPSGQTAEANAKKRNACSSPAPDPTPVLRAKVSSGERGR